MVPPTSHSLRRKRGNIIASLLSIRNCLVTKTCNSRHPVTTQFLTQAPMSSIISMEKAQRQSLNFWEEHMLVEGIREQVQRVGHYGESLTTTLMAICGFMLQMGCSQWHSMGRQPRASRKHHVVALVAYKVSRAIQLRHQAFPPALHLSAKRLGGTNNGTRALSLYSRNRGPRRQIRERLPYSLGSRLPRVCQNIDCMAP